MLIDPLDALRIAFEARRCVICGGEASVVCCGSDPVWGVLIIQHPWGGERRSRVLLKEGVDDINYCLAHAAERWSAQSKSAPPPPHG